MPSFYGARISKEVPEENLMCIYHAIMMSKIFFYIYSAGNLWINKVLT